MIKKTALVLSGGAFHGAFQVGVLKYLKENWSNFGLGHHIMKFDLIAGVSVGSLNGLFIALDNFEELNRLWELVGENGVEEIFTSDFINTKVDQDDPDPRLKMMLDWKRIKKNFPKSTNNLIIRGLFHRKKIAEDFAKDFQNFTSIADNSPLKKTLKRYAKKNEIRGCNFMCGYVSLLNGNYYSTKHSEFKTDEDFANGVLASTAMPIIWSPVDQITTITEKSPQCVDGGIRNVSPLGDVIREIGNDPDTNTEYTIIIVNCSSGEVIQSDNEKMNIAQIALRSLVEIATNEIFNHDIKEFIDKNFIVKQIKEKYPDEIIYDYDSKNDGQGKPLKYFNSIIIQPDHDKLGDSLSANRIAIQKRRAHGEEKAMASMEKYLKVKNAKYFTIT